MKTTKGGFAHRTLMLTGCFFAAAALAACGSAVPASSPAAWPVSAYKPQPDGSGGNPVAPSALVAAHNRWRAQVGVPGLRWSDKLAGVAQEWADHLKDNGCTMVHSGNGYGENLYWASPIMWSSGRREFQSKTAQEVTDSWGDEIQYYSYADNSCSGVCGHYTQVVWKDTKEVGCAMTVCGDKSQIWVCSYHPAGNFVGHKPY